MESLHRVRRRPLALVVALAALALSVPAARADTCRELLAQAARQYERGRLDRALATIDRCLAKDGEDEKATWREQIQAFELRAKTLVALDRASEAGEAVKSLLELSPDFELEPSDPFAFRRVVETKRKEIGTTLVATVSGTTESLREAPGTVVVVDAEQILRRGYVDLEEVLHDLPGFDITRGNGLAYSNIYQRGFRSFSTDRTLLLVDGVEQNDLYSNTAFLSRQYPLSNVERIEVMYGPASTIYGPNAFSGVINVITKEPAALLTKAGQIGARIDFGGGGLGTRFADFTIGGEMTSRRLSWSLTGRVYRSDEHDLSGFEDWDFSAPQFDVVDYRGLRTLRAEVADPPGFVAGRCAGLCRVAADGRTVELTDAGVELARSFDRAVMGQRLDGSPIAFSDQTRDSYVLAKLNVANLSVGFQSLTRNEGTSPWYPDALRAGGDNGNRWIPRHSQIFARYSRRVGRDWRLSISGRYLQHDVKKGSGTTFQLSYAVGVLDLDDLLAGTPSSWRRVGLDQISTQMRSEVSAIFSPEPGIRVVSGFEVRNSSIQGDLTLVEHESSLSGLTRTLESGSEKFTYRDTGLYSQATFKFPRRGLNLVAGVRIDDRALREQRLVPLAPALPALASELNTTPRDSGIEVSPRLAVVYSPPNLMRRLLRPRAGSDPDKETGRGLILKAVFSEAFLNPSNFERFSTQGSGALSTPDEPFFWGSRLVRNPDLGPERVSNVELSAGWENRARSAVVEVTAFHAEYSRRPGLGGAREIFGRPELPPLATSFGDLGPLEIQGGHLHGELEIDLAKERPSGRHAPVLGLYGNVTFTDPETRAGLRIGDIADWRANLAANLSASRRVNLNLRLNYVGDRDVGPGTTVFFPEKELAEVDSYLVANATLSYTRDLGPSFPEVTLQLIGRNLLDEQYEHPGVLAAGTEFAETIPQPGRTVVLRLTTRLRLD